MRAYSDDDLKQARRPFQDASDRNHALCVLGHLEVEERDHPSAGCAADIRAISAAVESFDRRGKVTAASASPAPADAVAPPAPIAGPAQAVPPPPAPVPNAAPQPAISPQPSAEPRAIAGLPPQRFEAATGGIDLLTRTTAPTVGHSRIDLLADGGAAARAPAPVDIVADMKRQHGKAA